MDDFNYLQDNALVKWLDLYNEGRTAELLIPFIEEEFLPRFERDIYMNAASKMMSAGKRAVDQLIVPESQ